MTDAIRDRVQMGQLGRYVQLETAIGAMLDAGMNGKYVRECAEEIIDQWYENESDDD